MQWIGPQGRAAQRIQKGERLIHGVSQLVLLAYSGGGHPQFSEGQQAEQIDGIFGEHLHGCGPLRV